MSVCLWLSIIDLRLEFNNHFNFMRKTLNHLFY